MTATGLWSLSRIREVTLRQTLVESEVSHLASGVALAALLCRRHEGEVLLHVGEPAAREKALSDWEDAVGDLREALDAFADMAQEDEDQQQAKLWRAALSYYHDALISRVVEPARRGELREPEDAARVFEVFHGNITALTDLAVALSGRKRIAEIKATDSLDRLSTGTLQLLGGIGAVAIALAAAWSVLLPRRLLQPIAELTRSAGQLAEGDLTARAEVARDDELGSLARRFNSMAEALEQRTRENEAQYERAEAARVEAEQAKAGLAEQLARVQEQQVLIDALSVPILPLSDRTLLLPLVGALDEARLGRAQERALEALQAHGARFLVLDVTGVPEVSPRVAEGLIRLTRSAELLGVSVVLVGIRSEVARAMVAAEIDLGRITTQGTLQAGVAHVNAQLRGQRGAGRGG